MTFIILDDYSFPKTITATYLHVSILSELEQMYTTYNPVEVGNIVLNGQASITHVITFWPLVENK